MDIYLLLFIFPEYKFIYDTYLAINQTTLVNDDNVPLLCLVLAMRGLVENFGG
jgi:hypothetical protein